MSTIALAGNPNCGKTAIFNALTGSRQKVGNYPGVTVERKEGIATSGIRGSIRVLDLPGTYSLDPKTPDEVITRDVLLGTLSGEESPKVIVAVADATNLERSLGFVLELMKIKKPMILALNMMDLAEKRGLKLDLTVLEAELGIPVIPTVAVDEKGTEKLLDCAFQALDQNGPTTISDIHFVDPGARFARVDAILKKAVRTQLRPSVLSYQIDSVLLHPVWGSLVLFVVITLVFQAVFSWAKIPQDWIQNGISALSLLLGKWMPEGALRSLLIDGIIAGVGAVVVFVPQILLLFLFILLLEDSGYMARAAFLMDRIMGRVGLHGRAFIPLLSSYACAIPGIMATRTIENRRDRLTTILVAPLTTCSARLPVYALLISAFIPSQTLGWGIGLQGVVLLALYLVGIITALGMAFIFKQTLFKGEKPILLLELPTYKVPSLKSVSLGLRERCSVFLRKAGTVILSISVILWFLSTYPKSPEGSKEPPIYHSYAGRIGHAVEPLIRPLGFDWRVGMALIPGFAAREVMVGALATVYSVEGKNEEETSKSLSETLAHSWSIATGLSLLMWYVLAPQCLSTLAVVRRETNSWRWTGFMLVYMTLLAYVGSYLTYHLARHWGL